MKRIVLLLVVLLMPFLGIWADTKLDNDNINIVVDGDVATITIKNGGGLNNVSDNDLQSYLNSCNTIVVNGSPSNDDFNKLANSWGFGNYTRLDLSGVTSNSTFNCKNSVKVMILPAGKTADDVPAVYGSKNYLDYAIIKNDPLDVYVNAKDDNTGWVDEIGNQTANVHPLIGNMQPHEKEKYNKLIEAAEGHDNITAYDADNKLACDLHYPADLNGGTLDQWLQTHSIKNLYVTGEMGDLTVFQGAGKKVAGDADFSGMTNSDYSGLKIPDCGGKVILPGTVEYADKKVTASSTATPEQISAALTVLKNNGGPKWNDLKTVTFADGSVYDKASQTLTISSAALESADVTTIQSIEAILNPNLSVSIIKTQQGSEYDGNSKKLSMAEGEDNYVSSLEAMLAQTGRNVEKLVFSTGSSYQYTDGTLSISSADDNATKISSLAESVGRSNITSLKLPNGTATVDNNKVTNVTVRENTTEEEKAALTQKLQEAGFDVSEIQINERPSSDDNTHVRVWIENGKVYVSSDQAGEIKNLLRANPLSQEALNAIEDLQSLQGATLVLQGAFNEDDFKALVEKGGSEATTVDMKGVTFTNENDAKNNLTFQPWKNTIKTAFMPDDHYVTTIQEKCLQNVNSLEELHIGGSVTSIPANRVPNSIKKVYSSNSVTEIENGAFLNHTNLELFDFGSDPHVTRIGEDAFNKTALSGNLIIPNSVVRIEKRAFKAVAGISSITIQKESNLEYIAEEAFRMDDNFNLKNVYVYAEKEIECHENAWDFYATDGQTQMATVRTRLHYPPSKYYWYVGDWKSQVNGGRIEGHDDLLNLRNAVDDADGDGKFNGVEITPKTKIGWQKFISSGIPVTFDMDWRTYSDIVDLKVPEYDSHVADVYIVCGYQDGKAVLKQMKQNDIIPAGTGLVIHHYVTNEQNGGVLFFPHVTPQEAAQAISEDPNALKPYRFVSDGDKRGSAGESEWNKDEYAFAKGMNYVGIETRDYVCDGKSYHNYLEAIHCMGVERAIYNAENGNYIDYNTLEMKAYRGQKVTYRNFFFGNGEKLQASMTAGSIGSGKDWNAETDGHMDWGFFRCVTDMYAVNSKAFLHYPADVFTQSHTTSPGTITEGVVTNAKSMGLFIFDEINVSGIATGIKTVNDKDDSMDDSYYTLQGVRVSTPAQNGIYIHKGKKIVIK